MVSLGIEWFTGYCRLQALVSAVGFSQRSHFLHTFLLLKIVKFIFSQLLAMDASAQITMKDAAKCDNRCEWQNSVNQ